MLVSSRRGTETEVESSSRVLVQLSQIETVLYRVDIDVTVAVVLMTVVSSSAELPAEADSLAKARIEVKVLVQRTVV